MNYSVYILFSPSIDKFYVGYTESLEIRLAQHNSGLFDKAYTKKVSDWKIFYSIECHSISQAIMIEKHIKKMKSKNYYFSLKKYPEITQKLKDKYQ